MRTKQLILRHWFRAKCSSKFHPLHKTWSSYKPQSKHQLPFDIAWSILNNNKTHISITNDVHPINNSITVLPKYNVFEIPSNYQIVTSPTKMIDINPSDTNFYTDGSCKPNPGKGAYGWFTPRYQGKPHEQVSTYAYPITIINCESLALLSALSYIKDNPSKDKTMNIFTDCQTVLQFLNFQPYPKYNSIRLIIQATIKTLSMIQYYNPNLTIIIKR